MGNLKDFLEDLKEDFGEKVVVESSDKIPIIPTGSVSLDISIGVGGIPTGRFTEIFGPESTGKTTICLSLCKEALKLGKTVLYIDTEIGLDWFYITDCIGEDVLDFTDEGVCTNFILVTPKTLEQAFEIAEKAIEDGGFGLIIFDSLAAALPQKEKEDKITDVNVALLPRILSRFLRRNAWPVKAGDIAFVFVNQVRDNIGSYISGYVTPGGHALKHFISLAISLTKGKPILVNREAIGLSPKFTIKKNKLSTPNRSFTVPIIFGKGIDYYRDLVDFSAYLGVLDRRGAFYFLGEDNLGRGMIDTINNLKIDSEALDKIIKECYNILDDLEDYE